MKYAVIDIGSNSVRLMLSENNTSIKFVNTTKLAEGLSLTGKLSPEPMLRTANAVLDFYNLAVKENASKIYVFATEAVRSASNRQDFVNLLENKNIPLDIVSGADEGKLGFLGAYTEGICGVLDVGGASSELSVGDENGVNYSVSVPIGIVRLKNLCGENRKAISQYISERLYLYGELPKFDKLLSIGGTSASYVTIIAKLKVYNPKIVDKYILSYEEIEKTADYLNSLSMEQRLNVIGLDEKRRDTIVIGGYILLEFMNFLDVKEITVRDSDNLEGYLLSKQK